MWWKRQPHAEPDPEARQARIEAERDLERRRAETSRVQAMTENWRRIRERNHFAAAIEATFRGEGSR